MNPLLLLSMLADDFHDIAPPMNYSLIPTWLIVVASVILLAFLVAAGWWLSRRLRRKPATKSPRERALIALEQLEDQIETLPAYRFSIAVSDILRGYVTEQYDLPVTRQTSVEFLETLAKNSAFTGEEKSLLEDFLSRCDLIKFARYDATTEDSRLLLEEAARFVKGGQVAAAVA